MEYNEYEMRRRLTHIGQRAYENNCWIRLWNERAKKFDWFTPIEFSEQFRHVSPSKYETAEIVNPLAELKAGRGKIHKMIVDGLPVADILNAMDRMHALSDKLIKHGFKRKFDQQDKVTWR